MSTNRSDMLGRSTMAAKFVSANVVTSRVMPYRITSRRIRGG